VGCPALQIHRDFLLASVRLKLMNIYGKRLQSCDKTQ
jgi:hypothetical protein